MALRWALECNGLITTVKKRFADTPSSRLRLRYCNFAYSFAPRYSLLAQKIEIGVTGGPGVNDRGKIFGKVVGIAGVTLAECEWKLESCLGGPGYLSVMPRLAIDRRLSARSAQIKD